MRLIITPAQSLRSSSMEEKRHAKKPALGRRLNRRAGARRGRRHQQSDPADEPARQHPRRPSAGATPESVRGAPALVGAARPGPPTRPRGHADTRRMQRLAARNPHGREAIGFLDARLNAAQISPAAPPPRSAPEARARGDCRALGSDVRVQPGLHRGVQI